MVRIMPVRQLNLQIDAGGTFQLGPLAWVWSNGGVDLRTTTPVATFRQLYTDTALLTLGAGAVTFATPVTDFPYLPPGAAQEPGAVPIPITLYPFTLALGLTDVAALAVVPYCRWSLSFAWSGGPTIVFAVGQVELVRV
jgi:hypothetical protein